MLNSSKLTVRLHWDFISEAEGKWREWNDTWSNSKCFLRVGRNHSKLFDGLTRLSAAGHEGDLSDQFDVPSKN